MDDPIAWFEVDVLTEQQASGGRINPQHGQLLHIGFGRKGDQTMCGNQDALPPRTAVNRQKDPIANLHGGNPRTNGQDTANTLIADQIWKRRRPVECSLDEEHVVVIDGRKFHADQRQTHIRPRLRDINQFDDVGWIPKRRDLHCTHSLISFRWLLCRHLHLQSLKVAADLRATGAYSRLVPILRSSLSSELHYSTHRDEWPSFIFSSLQQISPCERAACLL